MPNYIEDFMDRIVAMQKEAMNTITSGVFDAVDYWPYQQEAFPYCTNRLGAMTPVNDYGEDIVGYGRTVFMRLVVGHITEDYAGGLQNTVYTYIEPFEQYFREHPMLTTDGTTFGDYTAEPDYLFIETELQSDTGLVIFSNSGIGPLQMGIEFPLLVPYLRSVY